MYFIPFYMLLTIFLRVEKTNILAHSYILLILFDVMDNSCDEQ